jgi:hypothetical protein
MGVNSSKDDIEIELKKESYNDVTKILFSCITY